MIYKIKSEDRLAIFNEYKRLPDVAKQRKEQANGWRDMRRKSIPITKLVYRAYLKTLKEMETKIWYT